MTLCEGLRTLPGSPRIVVLQRDPIGNAPAASSQTAQEDISLSLLPWSAVGPDPLGAPMQSISVACQSAFRSDRKAGSSSMLRRCIQDGKRYAAMDLPIDCILCSNRISTWSPPITRPASWQGLLNSSIVYPLTRCLYGKRIHNPLGPDVGVSRRAGSENSWHDRNAKRSSQTHPLASLVPMAVCDNLQICQVHVGARVYPPTDWTNMSSLIAQVLGPIFLEMERNAACWQRTRGSISVPARGEHLAPSQETGTLDLNRMVETFQLGVRDLQEIWGLVLPPATLFELRKVSRLTPEQVHMPDELWARIVYDFALAHRLRTINRDHLLRSMTPLYLAWVVSYARELETAGATTCRTTNRAPGARIRSGQAILDIPLAVA